MGVSADHAKTLEAFAKQNGTKHVLVSDFRRQMLPAWDAIVTDEKSPIYPYAKRAYFIIDKQGVVRFAHLGWHDGEEEEVDKEIKSLLN